MHVESTDKGGDDLYGHIIAACQFDEGYEEGPVDLSSIVDKFVVCFVQIFAGQSVKVEKAASDEFGNDWLELTASDIMDVVQCM